MRKRFYWKLAGGELALGETTLVAAVLPMGNDAAPDGEKYLDPDRVYGRALQMEEAGAALIELAAETLRAGQAATGEEEQLHRVVPVLKRLREQVTVPVMVRTSRALVAERALEHGAAAIYDPSGLTAGDAELAKVVSKAGAGLMLGQMRGGPESWAKQAPMGGSAAANVARDLRAAVHKAALAHVTKNHVVADPGLGLGKRREDNAAILAELPAMNKMEFPLALHVDGAGLLTNPPSTADTDAAIVAGTLAGVYLIAAFDAPRAMALVKSADAIYAAQREDEPEPAQVSRRR